MAGVGMTAFQSRRLQPQPHESESSPLRKNGAELATHFSERSAVTLLRLCSNLGTQGNKASQNAMFQR